MPLNLGRVLQLLFEKMSNRDDKLRKKAKINKHEECRCGVETPSNMPTTRSQSSISLEHFRDNSHDNNRKVPLADHADYKDLSHELIAMETRLIVKNPHKPARYL
ncbi:uncharacterized protein MCYG_07248 [Microsporum canis CBS 113480]|uniref:Uncharacterized protein n=1 Tax=Arthroderma otae (strain ATCC MYA-4605 / CBS 113480) TaxID=554155 RepID=C5FY31_ARTOC|nr:uncharacterized protein MCYG_07248 [Microsporum canis CBS 113480]EEQ34429.1 predicted protein [Microsporum canis CBS 113480]